MGLVKISFLYPPFSPLRSPGVLATYLAPFYSVPGEFPTSLNFFLVSNSQDSPLPRGESTLPPISLRGVKFGHFDLLRFFPPTESLFPPLHSPSSLGGPFYPLWYFLSIYIPPTQILVSCILPSGDLFYGMMRFLSRRGQPSLCPFFKASGCLPFSTSLYLTSFLSGPFFYKKF